MVTKQIMKFPTQIVKKTASAAKSGVKAAIAPATPAGTWQFILGGLLSAPVSTVYSFLYNQTIGKLPIPAPIMIGVKVLAPLIPIYFVNKLKLPAGNIINGACAGVMVAQGLNILFGLFAGKMPTFGNNNGKTTELASEPSGGFYNKLIGN